MAPGGYFPCHLTQGKQLEWGDLCPQNQPLKWWKEMMDTCPQLLCPQIDPSKLCILYTVSARPQRDWAIVVHSYSFVHPSLVSSFLSHVPTLLASSHSGSGIKCRIPNYNLIPYQQWQFFFLTVKYVPNIAWDRTYTKIFGVYLIFKYSWAPAFLFAKSDNPIWDCFATNLLVFISLPQGMLLIEPKQRESTTILEG